MMPATCSREEVVAAIRRIDRLIDRASAVGDAVEVPCYLQGTPQVDATQHGSDTFLTGENTEIELAFNVPSDGDFFGMRLNFFLQSRTYSLLNPLTATDLTFRPADWTVVNYRTSPSAAEVNPRPVRDASAVILLRDEDGQFSSNALGMWFFYSAKWGAPVFDGQDTPYSAWTSGMDFDVSWRIRRGTTLTAKVTPTFSRVVAATEKTQFRVAGVFQGYKRVKP